MIRKAVLVRAKDKIIDTEYEPPLKIGKGICSETVENPGLTMNRVVIPPGGKNQRHYHVGADIAMHVLKGRLKFFFGPDHDLTEGIADEGDYIFIPKGAIHGLINLSDSEPAELVNCSGGATNQAETVFIEKPDR